MKKNYIFTCVTVYILVVNSITVTVCQQSCSFLHPGFPPVADVLPTESLARELPVMQHAVTCSREQG